METTQTLELPDDLIQQMDQWDFPELIRRYTPRRRPDHMSSGDLTAAVVGLHRYARALRQRGGRGSRRRAAEALALADLLATIE